MTHVRPQVLPKAACAAGEELRPSEADSQSPRPPPRLLDGPGGAMQKRAAAQGNRRFLCPSVVAADGL